MKHSLIILFWVSIICTGWTQRAISVEVNIMAPYPANLNYYLENAESIQIRFINNIPQTQSFYYGFRITKDGETFIEALDYTLFSVFEEPLSISADGDLTQSGIDVGNRFRNLMLSEFMIGDDRFNPETIFSSMILPEGNYDLEITAYDFQTDEPLSECGHGFFNVQHGEPPQLLNVSDGDCILLDFDGGFSFQWSPAIPLGVATDGIQYEIAIYELLGNDPEGSLSQPALVKVSGNNEPYFHFNAEGDHADQVGNVTDLQPGSQFVAVIKALDFNELVAFQNNGESEYVVFSICDKLDLHAIFPKDGQSVPFEMVPLIVEPSPFHNDVNGIGGWITTNLGETNMQYDWFPSVEEIFSSDVTGQNILVSDEVIASQVLPEMERGASYNWTFRGTMGRTNPRDGGTSELDGMSDLATFVRGMPPPELDLPEDGYSSGVSRVDFSWFNSDPLTNFFPPNEVIGETGLEDEFITSVHEKMVFQLATSENFELNSIVAQENYLFDFEDINLFAPDNSTASADAALDNSELPADDRNTVIADQLFGSFSQTKELRPGNYFWRVFYLRDPNLPVNLPRTFIAEEYYHMSEVRSLTIGENLDSDCLAGCLFVNETKLSSLQLFSDQELDTIHAGHFSVTQLNITSRNEERVSGTGVVIMPDFLLNIPIRVAFNNVKINFFKHLVEGEIRSVTEDNLLEFELEGLDEQALINHDFMRDYNELISTGRLVSELAGGGAVGLPLGIDFDIQGFQAALGLSRLRFSKDRADAHFFLTVPLPFDGYIRYLPFGGSICISPQGYEDAGLIHLREEVLALQFGEEGESDRWSMTFSGSDGSFEEIRQRASFLEFDCHGAKAFALRGGVTFPRSWLVPDDISGSSNSDQVEGRFDVRLDRNNDELGRPSEGLQFIAGIDFDPFQLAVLPDIGFALEEVYLDFSDVENAPGFAYPEGYEPSNNDPAMIDTWKGIFVKTAEIRFPQGFFGLANRQSTGFDRMLIDESGVTFNAFVGNFGEAASPDGALGGFSISLDTIQLRVVQNGIEAFELKGDLGIPLLRREDRLAYTAALSLAKLERDTLEYIFDVRPQDEVVMPFLMAQADLSEATRLNVTYNQSLAENANDGPYDVANGFVFDLLLAGELTISDQFIENNEIEVPSTITLPKLPFEIGFHSKRGFLNNSRIDLGSFDAPEQSHSNSDNPNNDVRKELGGFPVQLTAFDFGVRNMDLTLTIGAQVMLMENSLGVGASVVLIGGLTDDDDFGLKDVEFGCLDLALDVMGFGLSGEFCYFNNRDSEGLGVAGIAGTSNVFGMVDLEVAFGSQTTSSSEYLFAYGLGDFHLPPPGILLGQSGISMFGFGLGFGWNTVLPDVAPAYESEVAADPDEGTYQLKYQPENNRIWAKANVLLGGAAPESFHTDVELALEFQTAPTFGLTSAQLNGTGYVMTPLDQHDHSPVKFTLESQIRFPRLYDQVEFVVNSDVFVQMMPFDGARFLKGTMNASNYLAGNVFFMLNNTDNNGDLNWYVHAGKYGWDESGTYDETLMGLGLSIPGMESLGEIELNAYAMLGMDIPTQIRPLPSLITEILNSSSDHVGGTLQSSDVATERGGLPTGLGSGITFGGSLSANVDIDAVLLRANLETEVGFDVNLTHSENQQTCSGGEAGVNGWYGTGQAYAGIRGGMGIVVPEWLHWASDGEDVWTLFYLEAAIAVMVGGPNPFWLQGQGRVQYDVFGGLLQGEETFHLQLGEKCAVPQGNPAAKLDLIANAFPASNPDPFTGLDLDDAAIDIEPFVAFTLPIDEVYSFTPINANGESGNPIEMQVRLDSFYLVELDPYNPSQNQRIHATIQTSADHRTKTIRPTSALKLGQFYKVRVLARIYERKNNGSWNATNAKDDLQVVFRTTNSISLSEEMISYTYPPQNQKYLLAGEHLDAQGEVVLNRDFSELLPPNYDYSIKMRSLDGEEVFGTPVMVPTVDNQSSLGRLGLSNNRTKFIYEMPQLSPNQTYEVTLLAVEQKEEVAAPNADDEDPSTSSNNPVTSVSLANDFSDNLTLLMAIPQAVFSYQFSTSRYSTAAEKMDDTQLTFAKSESMLDQAKGHLRAVNQEGFDVYDLKGIKNEQGLQVIAPFFQFQDEFLSEGHQFITSRLALPYATITNQVKSLDKFDVNLTYRYATLSKIRKTTFSTLTTQGDFDNSLFQNISYDFKQGALAYRGSFRISVPSYPGHAWYDVTMTSSTPNATTTNPLSDLGSLPISLPKIYPTPIEINSFKNISNNHIDLLINYDVLNEARSRFNKLKQWYYHLISTKATHAISVNKTLLSGPIFYEEFAKQSNLLSSMDQFFLDPQSSLTGDVEQNFDLKIEYQNPSTVPKSFSLPYEIAPTDHENSK